MSMPVVPAIVAVVAAVIAWFLENAAIHALGYSGFGGAGWITAAIVPIGAAAWGWDKTSRFVGRGRSDA